MTTWLTLNVLYGEAELLFCFVCFLCWLQHNKSRDCGLKRWYLLTIWLMKLLFAFFVYALVSDLDALMRFSSRSFLDRFEKFFVSYSTFVFLRLCFPEILHCSLFSYRLFLRNLANFVQFFDKCSFHRCKSELLSRWFDHQGRTTLLERAIFLIEATDHRVLDISFCRWRVQLCL